MDKQHTQQHSETAIELDSHRQGHSTSAAQPQVIKICMLARGFGGKTTETGTTGDSLPTNVLRESQRATGLKDSKKSEAPGSKVIGLELCDFILLYTLFNGLSILLVGLKCLSPCGREGYKLR